MISKEKIDNKFLNLFVGTSVLSFLALWSKKFFFFDFSFLILLFSPFLAYQIYFDIKKKNFDKIIFITFSFSFFLAHLFLVLKDINSLKDTYYIISVTVFFYLFLIAVYFKEEILKSKFILSNLFFSIFIVSSIIGIVNYAPDNPRFCGGLKNFFFNANAIIDIGPEYFFSGPTTEEDIVKDSGGLINLSFKEYLFIENSHLGMIGLGFIIFFIYYISNNNLNIYHKVIFILFLTFCFIKSSATLLLGIILSTIILLVFEIRRLNKKTLRNFIILLSISSLIFISDKECINKFNNFNEFFKNQTNINSEMSINKENAKAKENRVVGIYDIKSNLSSKLLVQKTKITFNSIIQKPFGWGFQKYSEAHYQILEVNFENSSELNYELNNKDGMNNFNKIIVEFGIFGILFYFIILAYLLSKKIPLEEKFFLLPFIITQSIRGAGYFNGGFILIVFLILASYKQSLKLKKINQ